MRESQPTPLPIRPLLQIYERAGLATGMELAKLPALGPRFGAVLGAAAGLLSDAFLSQAGDDEFRAALIDFYQRTVLPPLHAETVHRRAGFVRHALAYLVRGVNRWPDKAARLLQPGGAYHVPGIGPMFWSALFQGMDVLQPGHLRGVVTGLERLGLLARRRGDDAAATYARLQAIYQQLLGEHPNLSALHLDHFLCLVAGMRGRELWSGRDALEATVAGGDWPALVRAERTRMPLRRRLKQRGQELSQARAELQRGLQEEDAGALDRALRTAAGGPVAATGAETAAGQADRLLACRKLWHADEPMAAVADFVSAELTAAQAAALLHLREPKSFFPWTDGLRRAWRHVDDLGHVDAFAGAYALCNEALLSMCRLFSIHPLELPALLTTAAQPQDDSPRSTPGRQPDDFQGLCGDTFVFLEELAANNRRDWFTGQRERYQFVLREPLIELARALAERYVEPVLNGQWRLDLETSPRTGKVLSSICRNDYGRSTPYQPVLWLVFCRRGPHKKKDAQFFVRLDRTGVSFGFRLGREARAAGKQFRHRVQQQADVVLRALGQSGALAQCRFGGADDLADGVALNDVAGLRAWAVGRTLVAGRHLPAEAALAAGEELVGEMLLAFEQLVPAYLCAAAPDAEKLVERYAGTGTHYFTAADFDHHTHLGSAWLERAQGLLSLKRQLILQGVPGTGKTYVARLLARWLTAGRADAVRLVQFHPAYSYEEFVEGIKPRSVEHNGRQEITYPVEDGVLCEFAARAAQSPGQPFVLLVDEINRGNLPRIFGELLYLLEYRGQSLVLPYSRREFRLPANLYVLATMNAADRSVTHVDQALRRRFSFVEMAPDAGLLAAWLKAHPPRAGLHFADVVVELFDQLNQQLRADLGPAYQVGHSYFMAPDLDEPRLHAIWQHQVRPVLHEYFAGRRHDADAYQIDRLLQAHWRQRSARNQAATA